MTPATPLEAKAAWYSLVDAGKKPSTHKVSAMLEKNKLAASPSTVGRWKKNDWGDKPSMARQIGEVVAKLPVLTREQRDDRAAMATAIARYTDELKELDKSTCADTEQAYRKLVLMSGILLMKRLSEAEGTTEAVVTASILTQLATLPDIVKAAQVAAEQRADGLLDITPNKRPSTPFSEALRNYSVSKGFDAS